MINFLLRQRPEQTGEDIVSTATSRRTEVVACSGKKTFKRGKETDCNIAFGDNKYHYCGARIRGEVSETLMKKSKERLFLIAQELDDDPENYQSLTEMSFNDSMKYQDTRALLYQDKDLDHYYEQGHKLPPYMKLYIFSVLKRCLIGHLENNVQKEFSVALMLRLWKHLTSSDFDPCHCTECLGFDAVQAARYQLGLDCENFDSLSDEWSSNPDSRTEFNLSSVEHKYFHKVKPSQEEQNFPYYPEASTLDEDEEKDVNDDVMKLMDELGITEKIRKNSSSRKSLNNYHDELYTDTKEKFHELDVYEEVKYGNETLFFRKKNVSSSSGSGDLHNRLREDEAPNPKTQDFNGFGKNVNEIDIEGKFPGDFPSNAGKEDKTNKKGRNRGTQSLAVFQERETELEYEVRKNGRTLEFSFTSPDEIAGTLIYPFGKSHDAENVYNFYSKEEQELYTERFILKDKDGKKYSAIVSVTFDNGENEEMICYLSIIKIERSNYEIHYEDLKFPVTVNGMIQY